jgi:hypothetical protein
MTKNCSLTSLWVFQKGSMILECLKGLQFIILFNFKDFSMKTKVKKVLFLFCYEIKGIP